MKKRTKIICWACDYVENHGEGILARNFVKLLKKNYNSKVIILSPSRTFKNKDINFSFLYKYSSPLLGIIILWFHYLQGKKVCYLNFLPLWNTFLFIFLPPGTILGPITGFVYKEKISSIETFLRKKIIPILFKFNYQILKIRIKKIIFSTNNLKEIFENHKTHLYNFFLYNFKKKKKVKKNIDFLIYHRQYSTKENAFIINLIKNLIIKNYKIEIVGHKINNKKVKNNGVISRIKIREKLKRTRFTILSGENLLSYFSIDALSENVKIFYNKKNYFDKNFLINKNFFFLNYDNLQSSLKKINKIYKSKSIANTNKIFKNIPNFISYFD